MDEQVRVAAESALGYAFKDPALLERALTHASNVDERLRSNERMEFLGDAVLGLIVCERVFSRFPDLLEGEMTKIKSMAVSRATCATIARELGLHQLLSLGKGMILGAGPGGELPQSLAAAALESVIAAMYLDGGYDACKAFVLPRLDPLIEQAATGGHQENFKSVLQQHAQQTLGGVPVYRVLDEQGPEHAKCFKVAVEIGGRQFSSTWANSKKKAEQQAALTALRELGVVEEAEGRVRIKVGGNGTA
jgi:ribonuclease-3